MDTNASNLSQLIKGYVGIDVVLPIVIDNNGTGGFLCSAQNKAQLIHFASKNGLDIHGLGQQSYQIYTI